MRSSELNAVDAAGCGELQMEIEEWTVSILHWRAYEGQSSTDDGQETASQSTRSFRGKDDDETIQTFKSVILSVST